MHPPSPPGSPSSAPRPARWTAPALVLALVAAVALSAWLDLVRAPSRGCRLALLSPAGASALLRLPAYRASARDAWAYGRCAAPRADLTAGLRSCAALGEPLQTPCAAGVSAHLRATDADPSVAAPALAAAPAWAKTAAGPALARTWTAGAGGAGGPVVEALGQAGVPLADALAGARSGLPWRPRDGAAALAGQVASWPDEAHGALLEEAGARAGRSAGAGATDELSTLPTAYRGPFLRGVARGAVGAAIVGAPRADAAAVGAVLSALSRAAPREGHELRWGAARAVLSSGLAPGAQRALIQAVGLDELERQVRAAAALPTWVGLTEVTAASDATIPRQMPTILR